MFNDYLLRIAGLTNRQRANNVPIGFITEVSDDLKVILICIKREKDLR